MDRKSPFRHSVFSPPTPTPSHSLLSPKHTDTGRDPTHHRSLLLSLALALALLCHCCLFVAGVHTALRSRAGAARGARSKYVGWPWVYTASLLYCSFKQTPGLREGTANTLLQAVARAPPSSSRCPSSSCNA
eukprot:2229020-Pleurochrysis_carterae.AAC.2